MKIRLFVPPGGYFAERWSKGSSMPPLGLLYIGAVLEKEGTDVGIVPADVLGLHWRDIASRIREERPDIVGVTSTTENRFQSFKLIRLARKAHPGALTVMGGPHASMAAEDTLAHIPELDLIVRGEGEMTTLELCRAFEKAGRDRERLRPLLGSIDGISYRDAGGRVVTNPPRAPIPDLDALPFPAFHLVPFEKYNFMIDVPGRGPLQAVNIMASRGCPFDCNFCATPINWGRHVRMRSPENVVREIEEHISEAGRPGHLLLRRHLQRQPQAGRKDLRPHPRAEARRLLEGRGPARSHRPAPPGKDEEGGPLPYLVRHRSRARSASAGRSSTRRSRSGTSTTSSAGAWNSESSPTSSSSSATQRRPGRRRRRPSSIIERYKDRVEASVAVLHVYPGTPLEKTALEKGFLPRDFTWTKRYRSGDRHPADGPRRCPAFS